MGRRKAHAPLNVLINNRLVGRLNKETSGAIGFQAGLGSKIIETVIRDILEQAPSAADLAAMPGDFAAEIHESVNLALIARLGPLETVLNEL